MQYEIELAQPLQDLARVEYAVRYLDPAGMVDRDRSGRVLRLSTSLPAASLAGVLAAAGVAVDDDAVVALPSLCCGGCAG